MMPSDDDHLAFDHGLAAGSEYDENKHLGISIDHYGVGSGTPPATVETPFGFLSRALDPDAEVDGTPTIGCGLLWWREGDQLNCIPINDPRITELLPLVKKGGSLCYGVAFDAGAKPDGVSYALFDGVDPNKVNRSGSYIVSTRYGAKAHVLSMNVRTNGKEQIEFLHGEGNGIVATQDGAATLRSKTGSIWMSSTPQGNVLSGKTKVQGSLAVGDPAAAQPVAKGPELVSLLSKLIGIVAAINATTTGAPAAALSGELSAILAKHLTAT